MHKNVQATNYEGYMISTIYGAASNFKVVNYSFLKKKANDEINIATNNRRVKVREIAEPAGIPIEWVQNILRM